MVSDTEEKRNLVGAGAVLVEHSRPWSHKTCFSLSAGTVVCASRALTGSYKDQSLRHSLLFLQFGFGVSHGAMTGESQSHPPVHIFHPQTKPWFSMV